MRKILLGIFVAIMATVVSTVTTNATNQPTDFETVTPVSATEWMIIDHMEQGNTWDCFDGGTKCKGTLKPNSFPNANGYYDDEDVISWVTHTHYETIP